jgi:hypothetical protein
MLNLILPDGNGKLNVFFFATAIIRNSCIKIGETVVQFRRKRSRGIDTRPEK